MRCIKAGGRGGVVMKLWPEFDFPFVSPLHGVYTSFVQEISSLVHRYRVGSGLEVG